MHADMDQLLAEKTAVVTGGASGIGRAIALTFAEHGADVVVADIRETPREDGVPTHEVIAADTEQAATHVECDVTDPADLEAAVAAADEFGGLDIMVNNAGIVPHEDFLAVNEETFAETMDINVKGVFFGAQAAGKRLVERGDGGTIINMASLAADRGGGVAAAYSTSKGAVKSLTFALADRFADDNIRVNAIKPSYTKTAMLANSPMGDGEEGKQFAAMIKEATPAGRFGEADEVAAVALFLASDLSSYVNGESIAVDGGLGRT